MDTGGLAKEPQSLGGDAKTYWKYERRHSRTEIGTGPHKDITPASNNPCDRAIDLICNRKRSSTTDRRHDVGAGVREPSESGVCCPDLSRHRGRSRPQQVALQQHQSCSIPVTSQITKTSPFTNTRHLANTVEGQITELSGFIKESAHTTLLWVTALTKTITLTAFICEVKQSEVTEELHKASSKNNSSVYCV